MKPRSVILVLCAVILAAPACTFSRTRVNDERFLEKLDAVVPGTTTASELTRMLGQPVNWVELSQKHRLFIYAYGDSKTAGLTLILFNALKTNSGFDSAFIVVDKEKNVVTEKFVGTQSKDLSWEFWPFGG